LLPTHNKGKKHQRLLNLKQERESSSRKSIYVRGFQNSGSIEEDLAKYFNSYGKVSNIFLDKDKVNISNMKIITLPFCCILKSNHGMVLSICLVPRLNETPSIVICFSFFVMVTDAHSFEQVLLLKNSPSLLTQVLFGKS